jgi:predicted CXXCH cytochrome family protein
VCEQCHSPTEKAFVSAHLGIDARKVACASCHDPHSSKDPKMFKKVGHPPFVARQCDGCHTVSSSEAK